MKNFFIFVVIILALLSIDHPSIAKPRQALFDKFTGMLSDSGKIKRDQLAANTLKAVKARIKPSKSETAYLEEQFATNDTMAAFTSRYCRQKELNSYFYGDDLRQICRIIDSKRNEQK